MTLRVLILGAHTFVGAKVIAALAKSDWATPVESAARSAVAAAELDGIDAVFNGTMGRPEEIVRQARGLYTAIGARTGIRVVHLSSMTVYGSYTGLAAESAPLRTDLGAYGAAQVEAESLAAAYSQTVILRPGCEYGAGCPQWSERIARLLRSHRLGDLGARGDGICNLVYADDLVAAIAKALRLPGIEGGCFNLAMASPPTWNEYFTAFGCALGAVPVARIGSRRLRIESWVAAPLKILELLGARPPPPLTPSFLKLCAQEITLDSRRAEAALGITWTALDDGLRQTAAAYQ